MTNPVDFRCLESGQFVFVEAPVGAYPGSCEIVITRVTPHMVYGVNTKGGYDSSDEKQFCPLGEKAYRFYDPVKNDQKLADLAASLAVFANMRPRQYVEYVHVNAARLADALLAQRKCPDNISALVTNEAVRQLGYHNQAITKIEARLKALEIGMEKIRAACR